MRTQVSKSTSKATPRTKLSAKAKKPVKVVATAPLASKEAARTIGATEVPKGGIALKTICAAIGINPKVARRELRKVRKLAIDSKEQNALRKHDLHTRWVFAKSDPQVAEIKKTLQAYVDRNGAEE